jgi:hypothetical protein
MHWPAVNADMRKMRLFAVPPKSKSMALGLKKRISSGLSHRWNKARRRHWIWKYVSPQEFVNAPDAGATGLFCGYSKTT